MLRTRSVLFRENQNTSSRASEKIITTAILCIDSTNICALLTGYPLFEAGTLTPLNISRSLSNATVGGYLFGSISKSTT